MEAPDSVNVEGINNPSMSTQPPEIPPLPAPAAKPKAPTLSLSDLKARAAKQK